MSLPMRKTYMMTLRSGDSASPRRPGTFAARRTLGDMGPSRVLVTGATGYIGGRLVPRLIERGYTVRVLARSPQKLTDVPWAGDVEVVQGDLQDAASVERAMEGVDVVYYLVHSMRARGDFDDE